MILETTIKFIPFQAVHSIGQLFFHEDAGTVYRFSLLETVLIDVLT